MIEGGNTVAPITGPPSAPHAQARRIFGRGFALSQIYGRWMDGCWSGPGTGGRTRQELDEFGWESAKVENGLPR